MPWPLLNFAMKVKISKIVLAGHSRGGATVFNSLTILAGHPDWETVIKPRIAFVVIMGSFDTVNSVLYSRYPKSIANWIKNKLVKWTDHDREERWAPLN